MSLGINHPRWDKGDPGKGYGAGLLQVWGTGLDCSSLWEWAIFDCSLVMGLDSGGRVL